MYWITSEIDASQLCHDIYPSWFFVQYTAHEINPKRKEPIGGGLFSDHLFCWKLKLRFIVKYVSSVAKNITVVELKVTTHLESDAYFNSSCKSGPRIEWKW